MFIKRSTPVVAQSLFFASAIAVFTACSGGGSNSSSALPPQDQPVVAPQTAATQTPSIVQSTQSWGTYNSTIHVSLSKAPAAGHVLVLFFQQNRPPANFPYSGEVAWPASATGSTWSYDGGTATSASTTAILHHVVASGETGQYTINVGGAGSGFDEYTIAEVAGVNASNPLDARAANTIAAGSTQYNFGAGITPSVAGTFPLAFYTAFQAGHSFTVPSGWKAVYGSTAAYSQTIASGPVQTGTATLNATATSSSASSNVGSTDVVLLNPQGASGTPGPVSTATPQPAPTASAAPVSSSSYSYNGCAVYTANDWFTTNLVNGGSSYVSNAVDPSSASIIANLSNSFPGMYIDAANPRGVTTVNVANSSTPMVHVNGTMTNDPYNDDPSGNIPVTNPLYQEGAVSGSCSGDCHTIVMTSPSSANPCVDYETYSYGSPSWNGSSYRGTGIVHNLNHPLNSQYSQDSYNITAAGLPLLGTTDFGEDATASSINHIVEFSLPGSGASPKASGGYVAPATYNHSCTSNCTNKLPLGARLRLKASYPCPSESTYPQSYRICNQLKNYGMIFVDWNGSSGSGTSIMLLRFGTTAGGSDPWKGSDLYPGLKGITINDFDVMRLGTIYN